MKASIVWWVAAIASRWWPFFVFDLQLSWSCNSRLEPLPPFKKSGSTPDTKKPITNKQDNNSYTVVCHGGQKNTTFHVSLQKLRMQLVFIQCFMYNEIVCTYHKLCISWCASIQADFRSMLSIQHLCVWIRIVNYFLKFLFTATYTDLE